MAVVVPFRGLRFNPDKVSHLEEVITPPYDVINAQAAADMLARNPYNMLHLDLRCPGAGETAAEDRHHEAARRYASWRDEGALACDEQPAFYLYHVEYVHPSGRRLTRRGLVGLVRLAEFSEGIVKPHEKTFDAVIGDRLRLLQSCQAQFSQVFSLYSDPDNSVNRLLEAARPAKAIARVRDHHGNDHSLWAVTDPATLAEVSRMLADRALYIADGHHRYTTALALRRTLREAGRPPAAEDPANHIMMYLCAMEDPGLSVLPTHRLLRHPGGLSLSETLARLKPAFEIREVGGGSREVLLSETLALMEEAHLAGETAPSLVLGLYHPGEDRAFFLRLREEVAKNSPILVQQAAELRHLDVTVLSDLVLHELLGLDHGRCAREQLVAYFSDPDEALDMAVKESITQGGKSPLLFLLNPTLVLQVRDVADAGEIMPHKSTYFYPKIVTGLVLYSLDPHVFQRHSD
ncbi:MAG: hypothetical protein BWK76_14490 [Desulfobulbaceae bacterium A2]|nr:MAG: hypothetical protein BWK76_14490 [Desulfobulbaceae bacterium A2]